MNAASLGRSPIAPGPAACIDRAGDDLRAPSDRDRRLPHPPGETTAWTPNGSGEATQDAGAGATIGLPALLRTNTRHSGRLGSGQPRLLSCGLRPRGAAAGDPTDPAATNEKRRAFLTCSACGGAPPWSRLITLRPVSQPRFRDGLKCLLDWWTCSVTSATTPICRTSPSTRAVGGYEALYAEHRACVLGYVLRRTDSTHDAADVIAETFLVAWRRLDDAPTGASARLWLYGVARRVLANHRRGERRRTQLAERLRGELARWDAPEAPSGELADLAAAFGSLADGDREVLALEAWEGLSAGEVAAVLGCSRNAAPGSACTEPVGGCEARSPHLRVPDQTVRRPRVRPRARRLGLSRRPG